MGLELRLPSVEFYFLINHAHSLSYSPGWGWAGGRGCEATSLYQAALPPLLEP